MKMLKETMNQLENIVNQDVMAIGIRRAQEQASFVLLLIQNTSSDVLGEEFDYLEDYSKVPKAIAYERLEDIERYEELFHKGWDFRELVEEAVDVLNIKLA